MHTLTLLLSLVAAASLPNYSSAASHPQGGHHAVPNPNSHGLFARSPSALVERAAQIIEDRGIDEALCGGQGGSLNMTEQQIWDGDELDEEGLGKGDTVMGKRGITVSVSNPKWPKNPKWKGNSQSSTTSTSVPSSTSTSNESTTASSTKSANGSGQIIVGGGFSKTLAASEPTQSKSSSSSDSITTQATSSSTASSSSSASKTSTKSEAPLVLPTPPSSNCAKMYTNTAGGAVFGPGKGDFVYSPRPSTFVKRSGGKLTLDGDEYRITGPSESKKFRRSVRL